MKKALCAAFFLLSLIQFEILADNNSNDETSVRYTQAYFARFQPVTIVDMINKIPGGSELLKSASGSGGRGFGANGSQILIDGKRMSGKSNNIRKTLSQMLASQVEHIQLIRGTAEGLDVRSNGSMLNVILKSSNDSQSSHFMSASMRYEMGEELFPSKLLLSHNTNSDDLKYALSYQYQKNLSAKDVPEDIFNNDGSMKEFRQARWKNDTKNNLLTANLGYRFNSGDLINLNGYYSNSHGQGNKVEHQFLWSNDSNLTPFAMEDKAELSINRKWEIGGDYESEFDSLGLFKTLFIVNHDKGKRRDTDYQIVDGTYVPDFTYFIDTIREEQIIRASMMKRFWDTHSLEYGAEGAFNKLDKVTTIDSEPTQNNVVSEDRYEVFITHSWTISDKLSSQLAFTEEFSKIRQQGYEIDNSRSFKYLKPRFELRYNLTEQQQFRFVSDRSVSQLNLGNFIVSRNEEDDTLDLGNPNLVPHKRWYYSLGYEQQLSDDAGSLEATLYYEDFTDHIDKIELGDQTSGVGNIGDASRSGLELTGNIRLGMFGLPNALVTTTYHLRDSETIDPFTGNSRPMKNSQTHFWNFSFVHDVSSRNISYGFDFHRRSPMYRSDISLLEVRRFKYHMGFFFDYLFNRELKLHIAYSHPLRDRKFWHKTFFEGVASDSMVERIESREERSEPDLIINMQLAF